MAECTKTPSKRSLWRLPVCWLGMCPHFTNEDDTGVWGECVECGNRVGFVSRATLRRYLERNPTISATKEETPT